MQNGVTWYSLVPTIRAAVAFACVESTFLLTQINQYKAQTYQRQALYESRRPIHCTLVATAKEFRNQRTVCVKMTG